MKKNIRQGKIAEQIHKDLVRILNRKVKDPRIIWLTINQVEVTHDYSWANIYYSLLDETRVDEISQVLEKARGFIRSELSKDLDTYSVPQLKFIFDTALKRGSHILNLINQVTSEFQDHDEKSSQ